MLHLTVSGHPGSGTSTLVKGLMKRYDWTSLNGGDVFRDEAKRRSMSLADFGRLCQEELDIDRSLDALLKERMQSNSAANIVESRLAGWWAYRLNIPCLRIWLDVDDDERARRVVNREGITLSEALAANSSRSKIDAGRFMELYGILPEDSEPYTNVISATNLNADEILEAVVVLLEANL